MSDRPIKNYTVAIGNKVYRVAMMGTRPLIIARQTKHSEVAIDITGRTGQRVLEQLR